MRDPVEVELLFSTPNIEKGNKFRPTEVGKELFFTILEPIPEITPPGFREKNSHQRKKCWKA